MNLEQFKDKVMDMVTDRAKEQYGSLWSANGTHTSGDYITFDLVLQFYRSTKNYEKKIAVKEEYLQMEADAIVDQLFLDIPSPDELKKQIIFNLEHGMLSPPEYYDWNDFDKNYPPRGYLMQFKLKSGLEIGPIATAYAELTASGRASEYFIHHHAGKPIIVYLEEVQSWKLLHFSTDMIK